MSRLPHGLGEEHIHRMRALALRLNCLTEAYAPLWSRKLGPVLQRLRVAGHGS